MHRILVLCITLYVIFTTAKAQKYTTKYDNINVDEILRNERLLNAYTKCLLDQGRCTNDGAELKQIIPDALTTNCISCSSRQRTAATRVIAYLTANKPNVWKNLLTKYDPQGLYSKRLRQQG